MKVEVLGPLLVDGQLLRPRERTVVAVLAARRGQFVGVDTLADALWQDTPPPTWRKQVQIAVGRVRVVLGAERIDTAAGGYALRLGNAELDAARFEALVDQGRRHGALGEHERAVAALEHAVALWRGDPYTDLARWPTGVDEAARLTDVRRGADEELLRARLAAGWHRSVVPEAVAMVRADPAREDRWAMLATALYRSGRQREALAALREARARLRDELGLDPGRGLSDLEAAILNQDRALEPADEPSPTSQRCPYRGLGPFDLSDAEEFFGREEEVAQALDALLARRVLVLTGPSGCGKSSLARAGLAPSVQALGSSVTVITPGAGGVAALRSAVDRSARGVLLVDQFEELFHDQVSPAERTEYARLVAGVVADGGSVVLTVRSDHLDGCAALPGLGSMLGESLQFVRPMSESGLRAAIEEPARLAGLRVESGLTELMLRDVAGEPAALPHLSHVLVETWARREGPVLTVAGYQSAGGIAGAIAQSAEHLYLSLDPHRREQGRSVLLRLVGLDATGAPVRRRTARAGLRADPGLDELVDKLAGARLVTVEQQWVLVAHESLAIAWPRLRGWLEEDSAGARVLPALAAAAEDWEVEGESEADLYRGVRLQPVLAWVERANPDLTPTERRFIEASAARERDQVAELATQATRERRRNRRLRALLTAVAGLLVVSAAAGGFALSAQQRSAEQTREADVARADAEFANLVQTSVALRSSQRDVAALLAAEAYRRRPSDPGARDALMSTLVAAGGFLGTEYVPGAGRVSGAVAGNGTVLLALDDGTVGVYEVGPLREAVRLDVRPPTGVLRGALPRVVVAGRANVAVLAYPLRSGSTRLVVADTSTGRELRTPVVIPVATVALAVSADGDQAALLGDGGELAVADVSRTVAAQVHSEADAVGVAYAGSRLGIVHGDGSITVDALPVATVRASSVGGPVAVDGDRLVTTGSRSLTAVDHTTGRVLWSRSVDPERTGPCAYLAASRSADAVFCGDQFGRIQRRDRDTGEVTADLARQLGAVGDLAIVGDGSELVAVGGGVPAVSRWRLDGGGPVTRLVARRRVVADGYDGDSGRILTALRADRIVDWLQYRRFAVWDLGTDRRTARPIRGQAFGWVGPGTLLGIPGDTRRIEYVDVDTGHRYLPEVPMSVDDTDIARAGTWGRALFVTHSDGRIEHLDPATGAPLGPEMNVDGYPVAIAPDPGDARLAVAVYRDNRLVLSVLDVADGRVVAEAEAGVEAISYAPSGKLYGASDTGRITRYDPRTLQPERTLPGTRGWVNSLQFSADGSLLLATANDSTATLYDVASGRRLGDPITTHAPGIITGYLAPNGTQIVVNVPGGVAAWDLDPDHQLAAVCLIAGRQLTHAEWATYLSGIATYRKTCETLP